MCAALLAAFKGLLVRLLLLLAGLLPAAALLTTLAALLLFLLILIGHQVTPCLKKGITLRLGQMFPPPQRGESSVEALLYGTVQHRTRRSCGSAGIQPLAEMAC